MSGPGLGIGPGLGAGGIGSGAGGSGSGPGPGGIGSGAGPGGVGSGAGAGGSGSIGGMVMSRTYPGPGPGNPWTRRPTVEGMLAPEVVAYDERGAEQDRLTARVGRIEWARTWDTGTHRNPGAVPGGFTTAHFCRPEELAVEVAEAGFDLTAVLAVEGPAGLVEDPDGWLDDPRRRAWLLRQLHRVEAEPSLLGASPHPMAVARHP